MSATNKARQAAALASALSSQNIELRGGSNARILLNYQIELGTTDPTSVPSGTSRNARALAALQASWQIEMGTGATGL
jgi:hypothetical protein